MNFDPINFLKEVKQVVTGTNSGLNVDGGFLRDVDVTPQFSALTVALGGTFGAGSTLSTGTATPTYTPAFLVSTGASTFGPFWVPRDYDQESDALQFRFLASTAGTGISAIATLGTISVYSTGGPAAVVSAVQIASTTFNNGVWNNLGISFSGQGLQYGDVFSITLSTSGGNYQLAAAAEVYDSCLVAWADYNSPPGGGQAVELVGTSTQPIRG